MPTEPTHQSDDLTNPYGYSEMDWAAQLEPPTPPPGPKFGASVWARTARCP